MATGQRNYKTKDVDMLVASATIVESAITHKATLQASRSTWADPFFDDLKARIANATEDLLGIDSAKDMRQSTQVVTEIQTNALRDLALCKIQIQEDFKADTTRKDEILNQLGYATYHKDAQKGDQEGLINLLYQFKTNLDADLRTEITDAGTADTLLTQITAYADSLKNADVTQESLKATRKTITAGTLKEFNEIYDVVISICKIATKFFMNEPEVKDQFSFSKVSGTLNSRPNTPEEEEEPRPE